jgi:formylglycine-generating enzyme required for sulfatase activity
MNMLSNLQAMRNVFSVYLFVLIFTFPAAASAQTDMQAVGRFSIDRTEVSIGQFRKFVEATKTVTAAERAGGGSTHQLQRGTVFLSMGWQAFAN